MITEIKFRKVERSTITTKKKKTVEETQFFLLFKNSDVNFKSLNASQNSPSPDEQQREHPDLQQQTKAFVIVSLQSSRQVSFFSLLLFFCSNFQEFVYVQCKN